jgi:glycerol-1-phosphate dehydrogenase [NAD(P)+]
VDANLPVYIATDAVEHLLQFCHERQMSHFMLVADQNTYPILGHRVEEALRGEGFDVKSVVLTGKEIEPNEYYIMQVLLKADRVERVYVAVGSGVITDITRFASHRTRTVFISVPTAPSVDGFTSVGAPLVIGNWKQTVPAHPPVAVFGDETTLRQAPRPMIASGFGDMLGKYTSLADWKIGSILWDEPYDEEIAQRAYRALYSCSDNAESIGHAEPEGICAQMWGLAETGLCMVIVESSRPAGGSEHHISHFLEMKLMREGRKAIFHGAKVGVACTMVARHYEQFRRLSRRDVADRLAAIPVPTREEEIATIRRGLGELAEQAIVEQAPFLNLGPAGQASLRQRIVDRWDEVQAAAAKVPEEAQLKAWLATAGGPTDTRTLGLGDEEVAQAWHYAHWLRNRFTAIKLAYFLNLA